MKKILLVLAAVACLRAPSDTVFLKTPTEVTCATGGTLLIAANSRRRYLLVQNKGSVSVYLAPTAAPSGTNGVLLTAGQYYEFTTSAAPTNAIYCTAASSTAAIVIQEGV